MKPRHSFVTLASMLIVSLLVFELAFAFPTQRAAAVSTCNAVSFVADVTVPDGTTFPAGTSFTKTWRLMNSGTCTWTTAYSLVFSSGAQMGAPASVALPNSVAPGQTVDLTLSLTAPAVAGHYRGDWLLADASGLRFGLGVNADSPFWVDINASGTAGASPTPAPVTPPTPTAVPSLPPAAGTSYDFTSNVCAAQWWSGYQYSALPCPLPDGDARGYAVVSTAPQLENGATDGGPGLIVGAARGPFPGHGGLCLRFVVLRDLSAGLPHPGRQQRGDHDPVELAGDERRAGVSRRQGLELPGGQAGQLHPDAAGDGLGHGGSGGLGAAAHRQCQPHAHPRPERLADLHQYNLGLSVPVSAGQHHQYR
jgi:hypothetical protein